MSEELLDVRYELSVEKDALLGRDADDGARAAQGHGPGQVHAPRLQV
ncbi:MAG: hypothetical protein MZU79_07175 [Anaerotruncus sp.]|nr:hypothetical protein [Anaerotruncus sp.]